MDSRLHKFICLYFLGHLQRFQNDLRYYYDDTSHKTDTQNIKPGENIQNTHNPATSTEIQE